MEDVNPLQQNAGNQAPTGVDSNQAQPVSQEPPSVSPSPASSTAASSDVAAAANAAENIESEAAGSPVGTETPVSRKRSRNIIKAEKKDEDLGKKVTRYLIPLVALLAFTLIVIFVYVPNGRATFETIDNIKAVSEEYNWTANKVATLKGVDISTLDDRISTVSNVVRDKMDVAELASEVEKIALENNLRPSDLSMTDTAAALEALPQDRQGGEEWVPVYSDSISGPFSFMGEFDNVVSFLDDLRNSSPTVLFIDAVSISRVGKNESSESEESSGVIYWNVDIMIYGYTSEVVTESDIKDTVDIGFDEDLYDEIVSRIRESEDSADDNTDDEEVTDEGTEIDTDTDTDTTDGESESTEEAE